MRLSVRDQRIQGLEYLVQLDSPKYIMPIPFKQSTSACTTPDIHSYKDLDDLRRKVSAEVSDVLVVVVSSRNPLPKYAKILMDSGFTVTGNWLLIPSAENPRWILPLDRGAVRRAGKLIKPSRPIAVVALRISSILERFGLTRLLFPSAAIIARKGSVAKFSFSDSTVVERVRNVLGRDDLTPSLYTGSPSHAQKFILQFTDSDGKPHAYAKVGKVPEARKRVRQECVALKILSTLNLEKIVAPRLLDFFSLPSGDEVVILSPPPLGFAKWSLDFLTIHAEGLGELFSAKSGRADSGADIANRLRVVFEEYQAIGKHSPFSAAVCAVQAGIKHIGEVYSDCLFPKGLIHGDFTPWNTYLGEKSIFVYDWELSRDGYVLFDWFNYLFHVEVLVNNFKNKSLINLPSHLPTHMLKVYLDKLPDDFIVDIDGSYLVFLLETMAYYLEYASREDTANSGLNEALLNPINVMTKTIFGICEVGLG